MYSKILIPLDGSKTAEKVLPYARALAENLKARVELISALNVAEMAAHISAEHARHLDTITEEGERRSLEYLKKIATTFPGGSVACTVEKGRPEDVILEKAALDAGTLIAMATHGRSGLDRWLLGSVAEKVLRGASNPTLVVRAKKEKNPAWEMATLKRVVVPVDGSELSERILPHVEALAKHLDLEVTLLGVYGGRLSAGADDGGSNMDAFIPSLRNDTVTYLAAKTEEMKQRGLNK